MAEKAIPSTAYTLEEAQAEAGFKKGMSIPNIMSLDIAQKMVEQLGPGVIPTAVYEFADNHADALKEQYPERYKEIYEAVIKWIDTYKEYRDAMLPNMVGTRPRYSDRVVEYADLELTEAQKEHYYKHIDKRLSILVEEFYKALWKMFGFDKTVSAQVIAQKFFTQFTMPAEQILALTPLLIKISEENNLQLAGFESLTLSDFDTALIGVRLLQANLRQTAVVPINTPVNFDFEEAKEKQQKFDAGRAMAAQLQSE